ncbi:MAG: glycine--tRNA ligase subunit beta [Alphaproteobacteria bacterium]|nr:glycine--tRNA ligase subunit beta [Alphaproteobacteria bacterium]
MADLLLELFSEEIPARMQAEAIDALEDKLINELSKAGYGMGDGVEPLYSFTFSTPRRLGVIIKHLPAQQADVTTELKGPKVDAPEAALAGFLKKTGLAKEQLEVKDSVYYATTHQKGKPTAEVLKAIIEEILANFPWPKSMRWGSRDESWVRPLQCILCLFDGKIVPVEFAGVKASNTTRGHRFLAAQEIIISDVGAYESALKNAKVIASRDARKQEILERANAAASALGLALRKDDGLIEEVTGLVEWPQILVGTIDAKFMDLPPEVLTMVMRSHQKYIALQKPDGTLSDKFIIVSNMIAEDGGKAIIAGNERVLRARFADARFFWDTDRKKSLADWAQGLETVTYHAKLGTVGAKSGRIKNLALMILDLTKNFGQGEAVAYKKLVIQSAGLAKADLVTGMVGEFAELQGIMGRYYALGQKESAAVADAIRDHYKPQGPTDNVPTEATAICVALADKLDTLISMFAIGEKPTGSKDPFALRRAALGVIRIVLENNIRLPLLPLLAEVPTRQIALLAAQEKLEKQTEAELKSPHKVGKYLTVSETATQDIPEGTAQKVAAELLAFFHDRLIVQLKDSGIRHDVIKAVIADNDDDLVRIVARAKALQDFLSTEDGKNLLAGYKRAANILAIEEKKDKCVYGMSELNPEVLQAKEEKELFALLTSSADRLWGQRANELFIEMMKELATLRANIDLFFDNIMVNCEDKNLRIERLRLLARVRDWMNTVADFSKIEG